MRVVPDDPKWLDLSGEERKHAPQAWGAMIVGIAPVGSTAIL
jgi:GrpB-like predicted nucleotidyltransferase (UPF0157 family)